MKKETDSISNDETKKDHISICSTCDYRKNSQWACSPLTNCIYSYSEYLSLSELNENND